MGKRLSLEEFENLATTDKNNNPVQLNKIQQKKMSLEEFEALKGTSVLGETSGSKMESNPDTQYYKGYTHGADFERHLGFNQPWYDEAGNAGTRILLNTLPGVIGNAAAAFDFEDYFNQDAEVGNDITRAMEALKEKVNQDLAPIYRKNNGDRRKPLDIGDSAWWFENGSMVAQSAAEFALLGYGLGAGLTKASQAAKWLGALHSAEAAQVAGTVAQGAGIFANAAMLNQAESILSATQVYDNIIKEGGSPEHAAAAASHVINTNRANILLNLSSAAALMKGVRHTRQLVKERGVLKPIFFEGAQEYMEETVNLYSENMGKLYGSHLMAGGTDENFEGRTAGNFANTMFSLEGLEAGILGFAGGAIQTGATAALMSDNRKAIKERAAKQQAEIQKLDALRKDGKLSNIFDIGESLQQHTSLINARNQVMQKLNQPGPVDPQDLARLKRIDRDLLALQSFDQFNLGTTQILEKQYQDIASLSQEDAQKQGFTGDQLDESSPVYYKTRAQEIVKTLKAYEDIYNKYTLGHLNSKELFFIKAQEYDLKEDRKILVKQIEQQKAIAQETLKAIERPGLLWGFSGLLDVDELSKRDYDKQVGNVNDPRLLDLRKQLVKTARETEAYQRYKELEKVLEQHDNAIADITKLYAERSSKKHQDKLRSDEQKARELIEEFHKKQAADLKKEEQANKKTEKAKAQEQQAKQEVKEVGVKEATPTAPAQPQFSNALDLLKSAAAKLTDGNKPALTAEEEKAIKDPNYRELFEDLMAKAREEKRQSEVGTVANQSGNPVTSNTGDPTNYTALTDKDITNLIKVIEIDSETEWSNLSREKRLTHAHNVLAYLARNFERVLYMTPEGQEKAGFADTEDNLNPELQDVNILDPKYLNAGDEITLKVEFDYNGFINYQGKRVKWQDIQRDLQGQEFSDHVPISVRKNGVIIAYMHSPEWITAERIQTDVAEDKKNLSDIRSFVITHGDVTTKITKRLNGKPIKAKDKVSLPVAEAFKGNPEIKVMYNGNLVNTRNYQADPSTIIVNQSKLIEGLTYLVLPVNYSRETKQTIAYALPVRHGKLSPEFITSLSTAARIYMKSVTGQPITESERNIIKAIAEANKSVKVNGLPVNFDITSYEGARNYFQLFVYSHNKDTTADLTLKAYLADRGSAVTALEVTPNGIDFGKGGGQEVIVGQFDFTKNATEYLKKLEEHLAESYHNVNLDFLNTSVRVPVVGSDGNTQTSTYQEFLRANALTSIFRDVNIGTEESPKYVNSIQAVIEFDKSFIAGTEPEQNPVDKHAQEIIQPNAVSLSQAQVNANLIYNQMKLFMEELSAGAAVGSVMGDLRVLMNRMNDLLKQQPDALPADKKAKWPGVVAIINNFNEIPSNPTGRSDIKFPDVKPEPTQTLTIASDDPASMQQAVREIQGKIGDFDITLNTQGNDYLDNSVGEEDYFPGVGLAEDDYKKLSFKFKIPGLSFKAQNSLVKFLAADINRKFVAGTVESKQKTIQELLKVYKTGINNLYVQSVNNNSPHKGFELILKHWEVVENMTGYLLQSMYNFTINKDQLGELLSEEEASVLIYGQNALEKDPKDTLSARFKRFLSDVENPLEKNFLGRGEILHYAEVYNHLSAILAGTEPVFNTMIEKLNQHAASYPWLNQVIDKLLKADSQIKNEFVVSAAKHYVNTKFALFNVNPKTKEADIRILDDNSSSRIQVIKQNWKNSLLASNLVIKDFSTGEIKFDIAAVQQLIKEFESVTKDSAVNFNITGWLQQLGIELHPRLIQDLKTNGYKPHPRAGFTVPYSQLFTTNKGLFKMLESILKHVVKNPDGDVRESKLLTDNVITRLAALNENYDTQTLTHSHRSGDRIIFSYADNKFVVSRVQELKNNLDLLNKLAALPFSKNSYWLQQLLEYDHDNQTYLKDQSGNVVPRANAVTDNFDFSYLGLQVLKEKGAMAPNKYTLEQLTAGEHEKAKLAFYFNKGLTSQGVNLHQFFDLTLSNKGTMVSFTAPGVPVKTAEDGSGNLSSQTVNLLFDYTVLPEIMRMLNYKSGHNIHSYAKGANLFYFYPRLNQIAELFNEDGTLVKDILQKPELIEKIKLEIQKYIKDEVDYKIQLWKDAGIVSYNEKGDLELNFLDGAYIKRLAGTTSDTSKANIMKLAATDVAVNYMIANVNIFQLISTDAANYFKSSAQDKFQQAIDSFDNIGKRLGGEVSPGKDLALTDNENEVYTVGVVNDAAMDSAGISSIEELFSNDPDLAKAYKNIKATDAQEFTTVAEHIKVLYKSGKLTDVQWKALSDKVNNNKFEDFSLAELDLILQPMKPIQVGSKIDLTNNVERRFYIKSSSFPLIPQLIKGHELEKVLAIMNKQKIDRLVFQSAFKVGSVEQPANLFDKSGKVIDGTVIPVLTLQRKYFRVQQEVPVKTSGEILRVSQASKLGFVNLKQGEHAKKFENLEKKYLAAYDELYKLALQELSSELGFDVNAEEWTIDPLKLKKLIDREISTRSYPIQDLEALDINPETGEFNIPIWALNYSDRLENFLISIVKNRVVKQYMTGSSFILGTEVGFKAQEAEKKAEEKSEGKKNKKGISLEELQAQRPELASKIIYTADFTGELRPASEATGYFHEVLLPWRYKDIRLEDYMDASGHLDFTRFDKELLKAFGMRIPNQGPNSTAALKVVGFLPKEAGDLVIAPRDLVTQMGSDFDIDKLYAYMYSYYISGENNKVKKLNFNNADLEEYISNKATGKLRSLLKHLTKQGFEEEAGKEFLVDKGIDSFTLNEIVNQIQKKDYQNTILDVHLAIATDPDPAIQRSIKRPLDYGELSDLAKELDTLSPSPVLKNLSPISGSYQQTKYINAASSSNAIGAFAVANTFNALVQGKDIALITREEDDNLEGMVTQFGSERFEGNLSTPEAADGFKSDNISAFLSAAVDDEVQQILNKINVNDVTIPVITFMLQAGFSQKTIVYFINQEIIKDYVKEFKRVSERSFGFTANPHQVAMDRVLRLDKYSKINIEKFLESPDFERFQNLGKNELRALIANSAAADYTAKQIAMLFKFDGLINREVKLVRHLQTSISTDGPQNFPKSVFEGIIKQQDIESLADLENVLNAEKLIGEYVPVSSNMDPEKLKAAGFIKGDYYWIKPQTISGFAGVYGIVANNKIWNNPKYFPYSLPGVKNALSEVVSFRNVQGTSAASRADKLTQGFRQLKHYMHAKDQNINNDRKKLLFDSKGNLSLASIYEKIWNTEAVQSNKFLKLLSVRNPSDNTEPKILTIKDPLGDVFGDFEIYTSIIDALTKPKDLGVFNNIHYDTRLFIEHLFWLGQTSSKYTPALDILKYIPVKYLQLAGTAEHFKNFDFGRLVNRTNHELSVNSFTRQYFQHNPRQAPVVDIDIAESKIKPVLAPVYKQNKLVAFTITDNGFNLPTTKFVSFKDSSSPSGYALFEKVSSNNHYVRLNTLGTSMHNEYDLNAQYAASMVPENNAATESPVVLLENKKETDAEPVIEPDETQVKQIQPEVLSAPVNDLSFFSKYGFDLQSITKVFTREEHDALMDEIIKSTNNNEFKALAEFLKQKLKELPDYKLTQDNSIPTPGKARIEMDTLKDGRVSNPVFTLLINPAKMASRQGNEAALHFTILHEMVHAVTQYAVRAPANDRQRRARTRLNNLLERYRDKFKPEMLPDGVAPGKGWLDPVTQEYVLLNYPAKNLDEFLVGLWTSPELRKRLQELSYDEGDTKTFWDELKEIFKMILRSFGVEPDTTAGKAMMDSLLLMDEFTGPRDLDRLDSNKKPAFEIEGAKPTPTQTINIFAGTGENAELSNFAIRPFKFNVQQNNNQAYMGEREFQSVEQAFQWHKVQYADPIGARATSRNDIAAKILATTSGPELKELGRKFYLTKFRDSWDRASSGIMKRLIKASFEQNPDALQKLLATGDAILTHTQDKGKWGTEFPKLLMEVRKELASSALSTPVITIPQEPARQDPASVNKPVWTPTLNYNSGFLPKNAEQENAIIEIRKFIKYGNPQKFFTLEGKAGTGKTTIVQEAIREAYNQGKQIAVAAVAHKAKRVLRDKLNENGLEIEGYSMAALLGMEMDQETGEFKPKKFSKTDEGRVPIEFLDVIIIDEASMINEQNLELIMKLKKKAAKVIFLGDIGQLDPIREENVDRPSPTFDTEHKAKLLTRVRQGEESPILPYADFYWENSVLSGNPQRDPVDPMRRVNMLTDKGNLVFAKNINEILPMVVKAFQEGIDTGNPNRIRMVSFRNETRSRLNKLIREQLYSKQFADGAIPEYVPGDILIMMDNFIIDDGTEFGLKIENASEFVVEEATPFTDTFQNVKGKDISIKAYWVYTTHEDKDISLMVLAASEREQFRKIVGDFFTEARKLNGYARTAAMANAWKMAGRYAKLDYAYALTSHKSQGSTFESVVVDEDDIMSVGPASNSNKSKSMYTAITRASKTAVVMSSKNPSQDPTKTTTIFESMMATPMDSSENTSPGESSARFIKLIDERQTVLNSYNKRLAEINLEMGQTADAQTRVALLKRRNKLEDKIDRVYQELIDIKSAVQVEDLKIFAENDLDEISNLIILGSELSFAELDVLGQKLKLWSNAVENLFTDSEKKSDKLKSVFRIGQPTDKYPLGIENTAKDLQVQLDQIKASKIVSMSQAVTGNRNLTEDVLFKAVTDIGRLPSETLDLSKTPLAILQTIAEVTKEADSYTKQELVGMSKKLEDLFKKAYESAFGRHNKSLEDIFMEKDSKGNITGNLVLPYAPEYLSTKYVLYHAAKEADKRGDSKLWKGYFDFLKDNEVDFDIRRLIRIPGYENHYEAEQQDGKHKAELVSIVGESEFNRRLARAEQLFKRYQVLKDTQEILLSEDTQLTADEQKKALEEWEDLNSPAKYLDKKFNKFRSVNYGYKFLESIPLKISRSGKQTSWYSKQFELINSDPDLLALHQFMVQTLVDLRKFLPQDLQEEFRINTLPAMQKSVMEMFKTEGVSAGMISMLDATKETMSSLDTGNIVYSDAQSQGRYLSPRVISLNDKIKERFEEKLKDYKREKNSSAVPQIDRENLYAEASREIAQENSFDIPRLIGAYASVVLSYKHKSRIEDAVRIAEEVFNSRVKEIKTNALGEPIFRNMAGKLAGVETTDGLKNYKAMLKYHLDRMFGVPQKVELKTEGKVYTDRENKRKAKLEEQLKTTDARIEELTAEIKAVEEDKTLSTAAQTTKLGQLKVDLTTQLSTKQSIEGDLALLGRAVTGTGLAEVLHRYIYLKGLGWNMFSAFTNIGFGVISNLIEASGKQFYTQGQILKAYRLAMHSVGKNYTFNSMETSTAKKIRTLMDEWDVLKKSSEELFRNKTLVTGKAAFLNAYNMQNRSEYVNQAPVMIAVMMNTKLKTKAGEVSLWDIYSDDGQWDADKHGDIETVFPRAERAKFKSRLDKVIRHNHGNYDPAAPLKVKEQILGRSLSVFRTWMYEGFANRFEKGYVDEVLGMERKGRYRSYGGGSLTIAGAALGTVIFPGIGSGIGAAAGFLAGKFAPNKERRLKEHENMSDFEELFFTTKQLLRKMIGKSTKFDERFTATDAANLRRNMTEINLLLALTGVVMLLKHLVEGDDDDESRFALNSMLNLSMRLQQDIGFYSDPISFMHIIRNPIPAFQVITDTEKLVKATAHAIGGEDEIPTGSYAGQSRTERALSELVPLWAQFKTVGDVGEQQFTRK